MHACIGLVNECATQLSGPRGAVTVHLRVLKDAHGARLAFRSWVAVKPIEPGGMIDARAGLPAATGRGLQHERSGGIAAGPLGSGLSGLRPGGKTANLSDYRLNPVFFG